MNDIERDYLLRLALRFHPNAMSLRSYIDEINQLHPNDPQIALVRPDEGNNDLKNPVIRRYLHTIDRVIIAFPENAQKHAKEPTKCLQLSSSMTMNQLLENVISNLLQKENNAAQKNVLCTGYFIAREYGTPSPLRNLDMRSPSSQVNILLSQPWRTLLSRVGFVIFRHLLMHCTVLLATESVEDKRKAAFLQLCGPITNQGSSQSFRFRLPRSDSTISIKRDLLYHTHTVSAVTGVTAGTKQNDGIKKLCNHGLPKTHHLQILPESSGVAASILLPLIFPQHNNEKQKHVKETKQIKGVGKNVCVPTCDSSLRLATTPIRNYEKIACDLIMSRANKKDDWHKIQKHVPKRLRKISPLLKAMVCKVRKYSFRGILGRVCPLDKEFRAVFFNLQTNSSSHLSTAKEFTMEKLINMNTVPRNVSCFLLSCVRQVVPFDIFGSVYNRHIFERAVHHFVEHRQLKETFDIHRYFTQHAMRVTDIPWLHITRNNKSKDQNQKNKTVNPNDLKFRHVRLIDFLVWMFRGLLIPILQQNFFITEGNVHKNRVFFYRREVWTAVVDITNSAVLRRIGQFQILSPRDLAKRIEQRRNVHKILQDVLPSSFPALSFHDIRYIPKRSALRRIQRPRSRTLAGFSSLISKNSNNLNIAKYKKSSFDGRDNVRRLGLRCLRLLMNQIVGILSSESRKRRDECLGASVFSLDDIYEKWIFLKQQWKQGGKPKMYACCVDVAQSFDTIPLMTLLQDVIPNVLSRSRYILVRSRVTKQNSISKQLISKSLTHVCMTPGDEVSFLRLVRNRLLSRHAASIFVDSVSVTTLTRDDVLQALEEFIASNLITVPRRRRKRGESGFAVQVQGVPQGHPLSPMLTSLFYGYVERQDLEEFLNSKDHPKLPDTLETETKTECQLATFPTEDKTNVENSTAEINKVVSLFMRLVDDTLFISNERDRTSRFLKRMIAGWKTSHGFSVNAAKTRASFHSSTGGLENARHLTWCGLVINVETLEIQNDYSRYYGDIRLRDFVTVEHEYESRRIWYERSVSCFKPKLHPILLDGRINSSFIICLNVYQAAILCSLKICACLLALKQGTGSSFSNPSPVIKGFIDACHNFACIVRYTTQRKVSDKLGCCQSVLSRADIQLITVMAFLESVKRKLKQGHVVHGRIRKDVIRALTKAVEDAKEAVRRRTGGGAMIKTVGSFGETRCDNLWDIEL